MRKIILFCVAILFSLTSIAQRNINYNDLYKSLSTMKDYEAYWALFQYLNSTTTKDYANANAYYQVGLIMQKFMRESDPFLDTYYVQDYISKGILFFSLSKRALEDREFRRQASLYPTVKPQGQRLTMEDVIRDIDERIEDIEEYKRNLDKSLLYLIKSVNSYNDCITIFGEINQENNRLNDLYFLVDDGLRDKINRLNTSFDTTTIYLDKFKASLDEYQLGNYKINYTLRHIPVYRLYGLNSSDFLSKNVVLWDFRTWVKEFNEIMNTEIAFLYNSAHETNKINTNHISNLLRMDTQGLEPNYKINPLIVNKMLKYDFNSATAALLSYQEAKVNYLYSIADNTTGYDIANFDKFSRTLDAYLNTVLHKQNTDGLLTIAKDKATPDAIKKYEKFYKSNFGAFRDYERYLSNEANENEKVFVSAITYYKDRVLKTKIHTGAENTIIHNNEPIYLQMSSPASIEHANRGYFIHSKLQLPNQNFFISGTRVVNRQKIAFAAVIDEDETVKWIKEFRVANADSHAMLSAQLNEGFVVVVSSPSELSVRNRILLLDASGNTRSTKELPFTAVPQRLVYDEIAQTYVLAFKGISFLPFTPSSDPLVICMLNPKFETIWSKTLNFDGYLSNVIKTDDNYYIYGAYTRLTDEAGRQLNTDANRTNMFVYPINANGIWLNVTTFNAPFSYYPLHVSKINNEYVDVIAVKDVQADRLLEDRNTNAPPYYMIIRSNNSVNFQFHQ